MLVLFVPQHQWNEGLVPMANYQSLWAPCPPKKSHLIFARTITTIEKRGINHAPNLRASNRVCPFYITNNMWWWSHHRRWRNQSNINMLTNSVGFAVSIPHHTWPPITKYVIKVGKALRGAPNLLTNANGTKSSWIIDKMIRFGSKMSSTF